MTLVTPKLIIGGMYGRRYIHVVSFVWGKVVLDDSNAGTANGNPLARAFVWCFTSLSLHHSTLTLSVLDRNTDYVHDVSCARGSLQGQLTPE